MEGECFKISGNHNSDLESHPNPIKRRKVRKGTFSCWECKRRKRRCERELNSSTCLSCLQHDVPCISQETPETNHNDCSDIGPRVDQVEALVDHLVQQRKGQPSQIHQKGHPSNHMLDVIRRRCIDSSNLRSVGHEKQLQARSLGGYLFSILPDPATSIMIMGSSTLFSSPLQISRSQKKEQRLPFDLKHTDHPLLFAQKLIHLALCLKQFDASSSKRLEGHLNDSVDKVSRRYHEAASRFVLSQDFLVGSLDGIETLILQSRYYLTLGDTRMAWVIQCRAINIARSINIQEMANQKDGRATNIWFQLVYSDRFMALMLGMSFTITEESSWKIHLPNCTSSQELELLHVRIAARIVARNIQMQQKKGPNEEPNNCCLYYEHYSETKSVDDQLKKAAKLLPYSWWVAPFRESTSPEIGLLERTGNLLVQLHQYYLIILLHQPYLLQLLVQVYDSSPSENKQVDYNYSKLVTASASREALSRYMVIRKMHQSPTYRPTDDKMYASVTALLFAHFDGHRQGSSNILDHQRQHDMGLINESISLLERVSTANKDSKGLSCVQTLRSLLDLEDGAAEGSIYHAWWDKNFEENGESLEIITPNNLSLPVPYFGRVHISAQMALLPQALDLYDEDLGAITQDTQETLLQAQNLDAENSWLDTWIQTDLYQHVD